MKVPAGAQLIATGSTESESLGAWRLGDKVHVAGYHFGPSGDVIFSIPESRRQKDILRALRRVVEANDALHNALAGDFKDAEDKAAFVAAQRAETEAIEKARALLPRPPNHRSQSI